MKKHKQLESASISRSIHDNLLNFLWIENKVVLSPQKLQHRTWGVLFYPLKQGIQDAIYRIFLLDT